MLAAFCFRLPWLGQHQTLQFQQLFKKVINEAVGIMRIAVSIIFVRCQINIRPNCGVKNPPAMMAGINQRPLNTDRANSVAHVSVRHQLPSQPLRLPETKDAIDANFITNNVVGYVGAMKPIKHGARLMSEVGSLKVDDSLRGHGVGTILFERIVQAIQDKGITPYAFCNSDSLPIAEKTGGREIKSADEIPSEALELCKDCPLYGKASSKKYGCCDTVMVWDAPTETSQTLSN